MTSEIFSIFSFVSDIPASMSENALITSFVSLIFVSLLLTTRPIHFEHSSKPVTSEMLE